MSSPIPNITLKGPVPKRHLPFEFNSSRPQSPNILRPTTADLRRSFTPSTKIEYDRLEHYNLNISENEVEARRALHDPNSKFFSSKAEKLQIYKDLLPYKTETTRDQYKYLSHVIAHLYISIKSLDLKGNLTISVEELERARDVLLTKQNVDEFIKSATTVTDGHTFEILAQTEMEANEDDENDDNDSDYYSSDSDDDDDEIATPVMKIGLESASIISVKYWTKELRNLLRMGLLIPLKLTSDLIRVFYAVSLSRGQNIDISQYVQTINLLMKSKEDLINMGFKVDWHPLYDEFAATVCQPTSFCATMANPRSKKLVELAVTMRMFFDDGAVPELMENLVSTYSNQNAASFFIHLSTLMPLKFREPIKNEDGSFTYDKHDIRHYLPLFFSLWKSNRSNNEINCMIGFLMRMTAATLKYGAKNRSILTDSKFGIFTNDQFSFIINQLYLNSQSRSKSDKNKKYCNHLIGMVINSISSKYSLENEGILDQLATLFDSTFTMLHPSNSGPWSELLAAIISRLTLNVHMRLLSEANIKKYTGPQNIDLSGLPDDFKINDEIVIKLVNMILPSLKLGCQSKSSNVRKIYTNSLEVLCFIKPHLVLDSILPDWYSSFDSLNSTHRIPIVIKQLTSLAKFMVELPIYRLHVVRFMTMLVPGIDANDPDKTILTTEFIKNVGSLIPLADLSEGNGDGGMLAIQFTSNHLAYLEAKFYESAPNKSHLLYDGPLTEIFEYDENLEMDALKSATSSFPEFINQTCTSCFKFLESSISVDNNTIESQASAVITGCFESLIESSSDEMFNVLADKFYNYVTDNVHHEVAIVFSNIGEVIVRRDPESQCDRLITHFMNSIEIEIENGAGMSRSQEVMDKDKKLVWDMKMISGVFLGAGKFILPYLPRIENFVILTAPKLKGECAFSVSMMVNSMLQAISMLRITERRLISKDWLDKHDGKYSHECWGGFQFDDYRLSTENLNFDWYIPTDVEVSEATERFENIAQTSIKSIDQIISQSPNLDKISLTDMDKLAFHLDLMDGLLRGICSLFDPSYKDEPPHGHLGGKFNQLGATPIGSVTSLVDLPNSGSTSSLVQPSENQSLNLGVTAIMNNLSSHVPSAGKTDSKIDDDDDDAVDINPVGKEADIAIDIQVQDDDDSMSVDVDSASPSGIATPSLTNELEAVDSSLTERSDILYSFGAHFNGDRLSKFLDPSYTKLHKTRLDIGRCLDNLAKILVKSDGYVDLLTRVINCMNTWINDCGYYSSNNPQYIDNAHFAGQQEFPSLYVPFTRTIMGARMSIYHCSRISISRCTRLPTPMDKVLIKHLVSLSASNYAGTASHAASVLASVLNRVINCTHLVFGIFKEWEIALVNQDKEKIVNIMIVFDKRRLRGLAVKNSSSLEKYESLIFRSLAINEIEVTALAMKLYRVIKKYVKIPLLVCILNEKEIECIRPPDIDVDLKINTLKLAKQRKKELLLKNINDLIDITIKRLDKSLNWKFLQIVLELIHTIHSHYEVPLNPNCLVAMFNFIDGSHPELSKKGMCWLASVLDTVETRAYFGYDLDNILAIEPIDQGQGKICDIVGDKPEDFFEEMKNFETPKFFIDNKVWIPTLSWNKNLTVILNKDTPDLNLNETEGKALNEFGALVTKDWILKLMKNHIDDSEVNTSFLPGIVYFFSSIATLCVYDLTPQIKFDDFFDIIDELYVSDERPTHVACTEIIGGVLFACKRNQKMMKIADERFAAVVSRIFANDLTQSSYNLWSIFSWWLPDHFDMRRTPKLLNTICDFDVSKDALESPFVLRCRIVFLNSYMQSSMNRFHKFEEVTEQLFTILDHPYQTISNEVATALFDILFYQCSIVNPDFETLMANINSSKSNEASILFKCEDYFESAMLRFLNKTMELKPLTDSLSAQEIAKSDFMLHVRGIRSLMLNILKTAQNGLLIKYFEPYVIPLCHDLVEMKDACKLAEIRVDVWFVIFANIRYDEEETNDIINLIDNKMYWKDITKSQGKLLTAFNFTYDSVRFLERSHDHKITLFNKCVEGLFSSHIEHRDEFKMLFTLLLHMFLGSERQAIINSSYKTFKSVLKKNKLVKGQRLTPVQLNEVHGATLGLSAMVEAYPYTTPPPRWLPKVLTLLEIKCSRYDGLIGKTAKNTLSHFKKTRQDTWHIDSKFFTTDQLDDLEGVLYKSYIA